MAETNGGLISQLQELLDEEWLQRRLREDEDRPNFWAILEYGRKSYEIRYSKMLRWLLDPQGNHGLGAFLAHRLAGTVAEKNDDGPLRDALAAESPISTEDSAEVEALKKASGGIDVLYHEKNRGLLIAIENKMYSDEHAGIRGDSQLEAYAAALEEDPLYSTYPHRVRIFLTGDGHAPTLKKKTVRPWTPLSYEELNEVLEEAYAKLGADPYPEPADEVRTQHARKILADFIIDAQQKFRALDDDAEAAIEAFKPYREEISLLLETLGVQTSEETAEQSGDATAQQAVKPETQQLTDDFLRAFHADLARAKQALEFINERMTFQLQDHTPNQRIQRVIRMIFNELVDEAHQLDTTPGGHLGKESPQQRIAPITHPGFLSIPLRTVRMTSGKGQGMVFYTHPYMPEISDKGYNAQSREYAKVSSCSTYISGDVKNRIPNDNFGIGLHDGVPGTFSNGKRGVTVIKTRDAWTIDGLEDAELPGFARKMVQRMLDALKETVAQNPDFAEMLRDREGSTL